MGVLGWHALLACQGAVLLLGLSPVAEKVAVACCYLPFLLNPAQLQ
jgi:hypothetical protein